MENILIPFYFIFISGNRHKKKALRGNKPPGVKNTALGFRTRRSQYVDNMVQKDVVVLVYGLIFFTFACLTFLLTFVFHIYVL